MNLQTNYFILYDAIFFVVSLLICIHAYRKGLFAQIFGIVAFVASFIFRIAPLFPGTLPFTNIQFLSKSTLTTFKFWIVTVTFPICPGNFFPLKTLPGVDVDPIEPGLL